MLKNLFFLLLSISLLAVSCKKEFTLENQLVSGPIALTQKSFTPTAFDANGAPTKAKVVQEAVATLSEIGKISGTINVDLDLVTNKSGEVLTTYSDTDGDQIKTTSSSASSATGLTITEKITGGTGKFAKITGSGSYFVALDFASGNGTGTMSWTVTY